MLKLTKISDTILVLNEYSDSSQASPITQCLGCFSSGSDHHSYKWVRPLCCLGRWENARQSGQISPSKC